MIELVLYHPYNIWHIWSPEGYFGLDASLDDYLAVGWEVVGTL